MTTGAPLDGLKVIELAGSGPGPFCAMMLADHGADVLRIARRGQANPVGIPADQDTLNRGRPTVELDLKSGSGRQVLRRLLANADALIEGFRPGVMERLGVGPEAVRAVNPRLVYGRVTGWGQDGPLAQTAGHDLNYAALAGAIAPLGDPDRPPPPPLNLLADFAGGGLMLAFGIVAAVLDARRSGHGQVVDCAMVDGCAVLMAMMYGMRGFGRWDDRRAANLVDGGVPFYACYETADGAYLAVCPLEPPFFAAFLERLGLSDDPDFAAQYDPASWPAMRARLTALFKSRDRDHWTALFAGADACVSPVLTLAEAPEHPHNRARDVFAQTEHGPSPRSAPRFSKAAAAGSGQTAGGSLSPDDALSRWGA